MRSKALCIFLGMTVLALFAASSGLAAEPIKVGAVLEGHVVEGDFAADGGQVECAGLVLHIRGRVQQTEHLLAARHG